MLGVAAFAALVRAYWAFTVDDTFIFLRCARDVAEGYGLTYNRRREFTSDYHLWALGPPS